MLSHTIMTLDFEDAFSEAFLISLEIAGYEVYHMDKASDALIMAASHSPDVLLLSANFNDIRNIDLVREFARYAERMECVLVCDTVDLMILAELYDCGNVYSHRPRPKGDHADLHRDIARAMERSAMRSQNGYLLVQLRDAREELHKYTEYMSFVENRLASAKIAEEMLGDTVKVLSEVAGILENLILRSSSRPSKTDILNSKAKIDSMLSSAKFFSDALSATNQSEEVADIHVVLNNVLAALENLLQKRRIRVHTSFCQENLSLIVNEKSLHQAFIHLTLNAIQAMHDGGALNIRTEQVEGDPPGMRIILKDSGKGIPAEALPRIYEPFFTTHPLREGAGLGLTIAKSVIEECGGVISVESSENEGTIITIVLPGATKESPPVKLKVEVGSGGKQTDEGSGKNHSPRNLTISV